MLVVVRLLVNLKNTVLTNQGIVNFVNINALTKNIAMVCVMFVSVIAPTQIQNLFTSLTKIIQIGIINTMNVAV